MMPPIQPHFAPVKNPAPSARHEDSEYYDYDCKGERSRSHSSKNRRAPKRESKPPAAATIATIVTPTGLLGFGEEDCIVSLFHVYMISLLDIPMAWAMSKTHAISAD